MTELDPERLLRALVDREVEFCAIGAVALNRGIDAILATDRAFEEIDGLERIDPADEHALATLTA